MDYEEPQELKIIQWVIKFSGGLVQNKKQANYVLIGFVALAVVVTLFLIFGGGGPKLPLESEIFRDTPTTPISP